jgi:hypothetical protein
MMRLIALAVTLTALAVAQPAPSPVSAVGKVSSHFTAEDGLVPFAFTIRNDSAAELRDLRIVNLPDGYCLEHISTDPTPACDKTNSQIAYQNLISKCLPAGQSLVAWGNFRAQSTHKAQTLLIVLHWKAITHTAVPAGKNNTQTRTEETESSLAVDLGENEVQSKLWVFFSDYRPFVIVVVGALLTFIFNGILAKNSRRTEIWKEMLTVMQDYGTKFYFPMQSATDGLVEELSNKKPDEESERVAFFFFLLLQRTMLDTISEIGGLFFIDRRGEDLMTACWYQIFDLFYPEGRASAFYLSAYAAAGVVTPRSNHQAFSSRFVVKSRNQYDFADARLRNCWELFNNSVLPDTQKVTKIVLLLRAFSTVLDCEINRPHKYWYPQWFARIRTEREVLEELKRVAKENAGIGAWDRIRYFWRWKGE